MQYPAQMATEYGKRLKQAMAHAGLSQKELVLKTGIPQSSVSSAINPSHGSADTPKFAKACGVSAIWLAEGEGQMLPIVANMSANIGGIGGISATGTLTDASKQAPALVEPEHTAIETIASGALHSKALAALFETLPQDQKLRAKVFDDVCTLILGATRQQVPEPESEPFHAPSPRKQSV